MRNGNYTARRRDFNQNISRTTTWTRNHNTVRHPRRSLGRVSFLVLLGLIVTTVGLFYTTQATQATKYDYELSAIDKKIDDLTARKEELSAEKERLRSIATAEQNRVATVMEEGRASGYAE